MHPGASAVSGKCSHSVSLQGSTSESRILKVTTAIMSGRLQQLRHYIHFIHPQRNLVRWALPPDSAGQVPGTRGNSWWSHPAASGSCDSGAGVPSFSVSHGLAMSCCYRRLYCTHPHPHHLVLLQPLCADFCPTCLENAVRSPRLSE